MQRRDILVLVLVPLSFARLASASDTHYQDFVFGERASGMGGAFTGLASDPAAAYYNPGGIAFEMEQLFSGSLNFYGYELRKLRGGLTRGTNVIDLESSGLVPVPTANVILKQWGRHNIALSTFIPHKDTRKFAGDISDSTTNFASTYNQDDTSVWFGPSYALRLGSKFGVGLSAFYAVRKFSQARDYAYTVKNSDPNTSSYIGIQEARFETFNTEFSIGQLMLRLGFLASPTPDLRLGLVIGIPSIRIHGSGSRSYRTLQMNVNPTGGTVNNTEYNVVSQGDLEVESRRPLEIRAGASYTISNRLTISADVSLHLPTEYTVVARPTTSGLSSDPEFVTNVERRFVHNYNLGLEWYVFEKWPLRLGAFTNFSSAPDIPNLALLAQGSPDLHAYLSQMHLIGLTFSFGYLSDDASINVGANVVSGNGYSVVNDPGGYRRVPETYRAVYFFLSGAISFATQKVTGLFRRGKKPGPSKEVLPWD